MHSSRVDRGRKHPLCKDRSASRAVQYLRDLQSNPTRHLMVSMSCHPKRKESLASYFVRLNRDYLIGVDVFELSEGGSELICLHGEKPPCRPLSGEGSVPRVTIGREWFNPRKAEDFVAEIDALEKSVSGLAHKVAAARPERSLLAHQAEWHIRGILYHLRRLVDHYSSFVREVSSRAATGSSHIIMYAPCFQRVLFEFYALVNLSRISLDNLRTYLRPLFTGASDQLPKSIRDVLKGETNCPVYAALVGQEAVDYLLDVRNCLVHYRSFATADNAIVLEEGVDPLPPLGDSDSFLGSMARAYFRRIGHDASSVNIYMPDRIFEEQSTGKLAKFTYEQKWGLVPNARTFAFLTIRALSLALAFL